MMTGTRAAGEPRIHRPLFFLKRRDALSGLVYLLKCRRVSVFSTIIYRREEDFLYLSVMNTAEL
jgi:hypothetical protein